MKKAGILFCIVLLLAPQLKAQEASQKKVITPDVYDSWKSIDRPFLSNDGKWVGYEVNPYKGNGELIVLNPNKIEKKIFKRGNRAAFSPNSKYVALRVSPQEDTLRKMKLNKVRKENLPKDSLYIWVFKDDRTIMVENLNSFKIPEEKSDWMAYLFEKKSEKSDSTQNQGIKSQKKNGKKNKDAPEVFDLVITNPVTKSEYKFKEVSEFNISRNGKLVGFIQVKGDSILNSKVSFFDTEKEDIVRAFEKDGIAKNIAVDNGGLQGSFIYSSDTSKVKNYTLYYWWAALPGTTEVVADKTNPFLPKDWQVNENGTLWFSRDDAKLYFGTSLRPEPEQKDTLLDEEKVKLDLWSWNDPLIQPQQLIEVKKEEKRNYLTVFHIKEKKIALLGNESIPDIKTILFGNADIALGISDETHKIESTWKSPTGKDYYLIDVKTGNKSLVLENTTAETGISPFGNYLFWFNRTEKAWYAQNIKTKNKVNLTSKLNIRFDDEELDEPRETDSYSFAGWSKNDGYFLVYDRYDIWKLDPKGNEPPMMITNGYGRKNDIRFRYIQLNKDLTHINLDEKLFLSAFNRKNKQSGYFQILPSQKGDPQKIIMDNYSFNQPQKAKNSIEFIFQKGSIAEFPDVWYTDEKFSDPVKISDANPQQQDYLWATVELVKWTTFDGKEEEGLLYKPENFDPFKKYPMVVYFYDVASDNLFGHITPKPSRSIINATEYASNGYLVFIPNIRYQTGEPGKSAYNYVVSGVKSLLSKGFIDEKNIGLQGQSWGGYQIAFLVTQTNMFKAASAGAPVANMTSAYGGIRWETGMSRMFQYENTQSRIGATLWEKPELYIQNSPLFFADKVQTPLLIMSNDNDGAVPWEQGIELYMALRRLSKPVWLLNYNGEPHNLKDKSPNCKDLSIRLMQYFNFYLKNEPAPSWLIKGIPAIKKGKTLGYEYYKQDG
ncbi:MAG: prolyl oligopeptidase family serine peptidase [Bacteroidales bacterium]